MSKPKDLWELPIKRSVVRREVFKIHPIYRQEYEDAFQYYLRRLESALAVRPQAELRKLFIYSPQARELAQRWGLSLALQPDDELWDTPPGTAPALFEDPGFAVTVLPYGKVKTNPSPPENTLDRIDITPLLKEGRYLCLEIDLFSSKGQIEVEIKDAVARFQATIVRLSKPEGGPKTNFPHSPSESSIDFYWWETEQVQEDQASNVDKKPGRGPSLYIYLDDRPVNSPVTIFQVWNMNKKEGKSPWVIAQELNTELKTLTAKKCTRKKCPEKLDFQALNRQEEG
jgi:hypothetical protein